MPHPELWPRLDAALDELLDLHESEWGAAVIRLSGGDAHLQAELVRLAGGLRGGKSRLDAAAVEALRAPSEQTGSLAAGTTLGPWRITGWIGAGGMGEVYRAERSDGQFEQQVAIKLVRVGTHQGVERFQRERRIVAGLEHPLIARLLDAGLAPDGRPYMVMELVEGQPITRWCEQAHASLAQRLHLFGQVCEAVAYAHRHLVVHRDIKPGNVLVTPEGRPKLLDFGVARWLDDDDSTATRELLLTPSYASPEQVAGGPVTTASDVYALGLLMHELLVGAPAFALQDLPLAAALQRVLSTEAPPPSRAARGHADSPVPAAQLRGDLDAIVAKATRKQPEARYASVDALRTDLQRHSRHEPVLARQGNWAYLAGRALRRHRSATVTGALVLLALLGGAGLAAWQARAAEREAQRANAVKSYLLQVFRASDPRVASDRPRGQITARELLDLGAARIDNEFAGQPELQRELMGELASIYRELGERQRYEALQATRLMRAEQAGDLRAVAEVWINRASDALDNSDRVAAHQSLALAGSALSRAGLGASLLQARLWLTQAQAMDPDQTDQRGEALERARALYERLDRHHPGLVTTLIEQGLLRYDQQDNLGAVALYEVAIRAYEHAHDRDDGEAQTLWGNLSHALLNLGRYDEAARASERALDMAKRTYGEAHSDYWVPAAHHARLLHLQGQRQPAWALMAHVVAMMAEPAHGEAREAQSSQLDMWVAEGASRQALPLAQAYVARGLEQPLAPNTVRRGRLRWGEALWQAGQPAEARRQLQLALDEYRAKEAPAAQTRLWATGLLGRFLLAQGEAAAAEPLLREVVAADGGRHLAHTALAQADLADLARQAGDLPRALELSAEAMTAWGEVKGFRDVRMGADVRLARARALWAAGRADEALRLADSVRADCLQWDAPESPRLAQASSLLGAAPLQPSGQAHQAQQGQ